MSVSALDQLLLSVTSKPSSLSSRRNFLFHGQSSSSSVPSSRPNASKKETALRNQQRKRSHHTGTCSVPRPLVLSPRGYGVRASHLLRKSSSLLLAGFRIDTSKLSSYTLSSDSNVNYFFEKIQKTSKHLSSPRETKEATGQEIRRRRQSFAFPWRVRTPAMLTDRRKSANVAETHKRHCEQQQPAKERRAGSSGSRKRRGSTSSVARGRGRSRRSSSYEPHRETSHHEGREMLAQRSHSAGEMSRPDAVDHLPSPAAEANAQLSFELMERKVTTEQVTAWQSDDDNDEQAAAHALQATHKDADPEMAALRAENAEQKALIRALLIENQRLLSQQQQQQQAATASDEQLISSAIGRRRASLAFELVDGQETFVDHKFDHLVSEITSELAELLTEDSSVWSSGCSSWSSSRSSSSCSNRGHRSSTSGSAASHCSA